MTIVIIRYKYIFIFKGITTMYFDNLNSWSIQKCSFCKLTKYVIKMLNWYKNNYLTVLVTIFINCTLQRQRIAILKKHKHFIKYDNTHYKNKFLRNDRRTNMTTAKHQLEIFKMIVLLCVCVSIKNVHQIYDT